MTEAALTLNGQLTFDRVPKLLANLPKQISETLDLTAVTHCDSAGLALLLECRRRAGGKLQLSGVSSQVATLIQFYQLDALLIGNTGFGDIASKPL